MTDTIFVATIDENNGLIHQGEMSFDEMKAGMIQDNEGLPDDESGLKQHITSVLNSLTEKDNEFVILADDCDYFLYLFYARSRKDLRKLIAQHKNLSVEEYGEKYGWGNSNLDLNWSQDLQNAFNFASEISDLAMQLLESSNPNEQQYHFLKKIDLNAVFIIGSLNNHRLRNLT